jgi:hypothetical protein
MRTVKITYGDGTVVDAVLLSRQGDALRAAIRGDDSDVREFTCVKGHWVSEQCELVVIEFEWQRSPTAKVPTEEDCICSKVLAAKLIAKLQGRAGIHKITAAEPHVSARRGRVQARMEDLRIH